MRRCRVCHAGCDFDIGRDGLRPMKHFSCLFRDGGRSESLDKLIDRTVGSQLWFFGHYLFDGRGQFGCETLRFADANVLTQMPV